MSDKADVKYRAFYLSLNIIKFIDTFDHRSSLKTISNQLIRAVTSIGANIVEAKSSSSKREFINYFQISLKSANETKYWLALLKELEPSNSQEIEKFITETIEISKILASSILTMKGKKQL
ncbi:MAG: four helix bundle protein [Candidatus Shapirobacteria bacterium]